MNTRMFRVRPFQPPGWRSAVRLLAAAVLCACLAPAQPAAQAVPLPEQPPILPQVNGTQYLSIPAAAFHPDGYSFSYDYTNNGSDLVHQGYAGGGSPAYYAPLMLPDFSTITKVTFWYSKSSVSGDHSLQLIRTLLSDGSIPTFNILAELHSDAASGYGSASTAAGFSALVDNGGYSYTLKYSTDRTNDTFYRVRVEYSLPGGTPVPETLNIPTATFVSYSDDQLIYTTSSQILNGSLSSTYHVQAPVLLPQGATILNTTFYLYDADSDANIEAHLHRTDLKGSWDPALAMADLVSSASPGWDSISAPPARYSVIDNSNYAYWLYYQLPPMSGGGFTLIGREFNLDFQRGAAYPIQSISIPAAAFTPKEDGQSYENHGRFLKSLDDNQTYVAPLNIPHGKYIRRVKFFYEHHNAPTYETRAYLRGMEAPLGSLYPNIYLESGGSGWTSTDSGPLSGIQVNNQTTRYWLEWQVLFGYTESSYVLPSGMVVEVSDFNTLLFLPMVSK